MHILIALVGIAISAYIWLNRAQRASDVAGDLIGAANDVKNAARRFGFRRRSGQHVVEGIDDPSLAIGAIAMAFWELDDLPTADARAHTDLSLRKHLGIDAETAQEIAILGRWFVEESGGPTQGFERLTRKLRKLDGGGSFQTLMVVLGDITAIGGGTPSARQSEALSELARIFRLQ